MNSIATIAGKAALSAAMALSLAVPALAQAMPSYAVPDGPQAAAPPQRPSYAVNEEKIVGRISSIPGKYDIEVRDSRGFIDRVHLHDGTVINPTGLRLATGMSVQVYGVNRGSAFEANVIDTRYITYGSAYGPYPYGPYYGYAPWQFSIGVGFGWGGWRGWR